MSTGMEPQELELRMEENDLYREDVYTDRRVGTLRQLTPVTPDGKEDPARPVHFVGQAQLWTQMGPLPITFEIEATDLAGALAAFPAAAKEALEQTMEEARELRRQQASQIVVPEMGGGMGGMGGMGGGGGKIQMP